MPERLAILSPKDKQMQQTGEKGGRSKIEKFAVISREQAMPEAKKKEAAAHQKEPLHIEGDNNQIRTYTNPTARENAADLANGVGNITAPLQIIGGIALMPFTAGLSAGLIAGGVGDYATNGYAESDKSAQANKRLLYEAQSNKHDIVINETPNEPGKADLKDSSEPIPLKPGYVEVISHDPETKKTVVNVKHEAFPHEAAVFVAPKKKEAKQETVTQQDVALAA